MPIGTRFHMNTTAFRSLARDYRRTWAVRFAMVDTQGKRQFASGWWRGSDAPERQELMAFVVQEGLRWGEPTITYGPGGDMFWAVPLMHNALLQGGLVAVIHEDVLFPGQSSQPIADLQRACTQLRVLAEQHNLTNAALLEQHRWQSLREQERAELLQTSKVDAPQRVRQLYLHVEPQLMAAIRRADRAEARAAVNSILIALLNAAGDHFELARSFLIELVATMSRTAVEAGGDAQHLWGTGAQSLLRMAKAETMESLSAHLGEVLERTIGVMEKHRDSFDGIVIANAVTMMRQHFDEILTRDGVAEAMHLSPAHFSRLFKQHTGQTFSQLHTRIRLDHASELLVRTDLPLDEVARRSGFQDAGYFGKAFRQNIGQNPGAYRKERQISKVNNRSRR